MTDSLPQTQRSHCEKRMMTLANGTTKDNLCNLIEKRTCYQATGVIILEKPLVKKKHNHSQNHCQNVI